MLDIFAFKAIGTLLDELYFLMQCMRIKAIPVSRTFRWLVLAEYFKMYILASNFVHSLLKRMALVLLVLIYSTLRLNINWFANYVALKASIIIMLAKI